MTASNGKGVVDLDALIAEAAAEAKHVRLGGQVYDLPAEFPLATPIFLQEERPREALAALFGAEHVDAVLPHITVDVMLTIASKVYGIDLPNLSASSPPSSANGKRSRPTGKVTTG